MTRLSRRQPGMDPTMNIEPSRIDDLLAAYRALQSQFDRVLERVRRAEEH